MTDEWNQKQRHFHIDLACGMAQFELEKMAHELTKHVNRSYGQITRRTLARIELARREAGK